MRGWRRYRNIVKLSKKAKCTVTFDQDCRTNKGSIINSHSKYDYIDFNVYTHAFSVSFPWFLSFLCPIRQSYCYYFPSVSCVSLSGWDISSIYMQCTTLDNPYSVACPFLYCFSELARHHTESGKTFYGKQSTTQATNLYRNQSCIGPVSRSNMESFSVTDVLSGLVNYDLHPVERVSKPVFVKFQVHYQDQLSEKLLDWACLRIVSITDTSVSYKRFEIRRWTLELVAQETEFNRESVLAVLLVELLHVKREFGVIQSFLQLVPVLFRAIRQLRCKIVERNVSAAAQQCQATWSWAPNPCCHITSLQFQAVFTKDRVIVLCIEFSFWECLRRTDSDGGELHGFVDSPDDCMDGVAVVFRQSTEDVETQSSGRGQNKAQPCNPRPQRPVSENEADSVKGGAFHESREQLLCCWVHILGGLDFLAVTFCEECWKKKLYLTDEVSWVWTREVNQ